jgi:3-keto-5-aminohexanoate cleavage enzyme
MPEVQAAHARSLVGVAIRLARLPDDRAGIIAVLETANMHHLPSSEMHDLDVGEWYVAVREGQIVGVGGFRFLSADGERVGKTTLLAVLPTERANGIGRSLQELRMRLMRDGGATRVITNADRPETIEWYKRHFGYREVGTVAKTREFGLAEVDHWTTLEAPLS